MTRGNFLVVKSTRSQVSHLLLSSALCGTAVFWAAPTYAQTASSPEAQPAVGSAPSVNKTPGTKASSEDIVVTGSRLRRRDLVSTSPITTVSSELLQDSGHITLEDTLNNFPQLAPDNTSTTNQSGGSGVLNVNLRSLGAVRTLVLVDGRRYIPADVTGLVDLATIPDLMVDRVEIITGGASAVYGSDAVAGAINFVLKRNFEGAQAQYQFGESDRGDGISHKADVLFGVNSANGKGNITAYASYTKRDAIYAGDRSFSAQPFLADANGVFQPFGSGNIPGGLISINASQISQFTGVPDLNNASGRCNINNAGIRFGTSGQPLAFCRRLDQYNYAAPKFREAAADAANGENATICRIEYPAVLRKEGSELRREHRVSICISDQYRARALPRAARTDCLWRLLISVHFACIEELAVCLDVIGQFVMRRDRCLVPMERAQ